MFGVNRFHPFEATVSFPVAMNRLMENSSIRSPWGAEWSNMALDVYETESDVVVKASVPGIKPEDIEVTVLGNELTIKGEYKSEQETQERNYIRRERSTGSFSRVVTVPDSVKADAANAE